ncbi:magnesium transporter [Beggiatoa leptomitoformis]|uniref:Magnesium transporter MgtE n=1 Tax=Beggiatoa leptomitoformis TaxID=288004 RepID=A0A2N9YBZ1_9GAMM|nr:magnesium transporter [Beggiatoa leptomitoformis]ALG66701.1 magnesium transporter [Beggiatoa leptomitoformis]AUI67971.1 magnesium transporter [Beggiatoa leptomitoformis]
METLPKTTPVTLEELYNAWQKASFDELNELLAEAHPSDIARFLESLPTKQRVVVWKSTEFDRAEVLSYMHDAERAELIHRMGAEEVAAATTEMDTDDAVDLLQSLSEQRVEQVLMAMDEEHRQQLSKVLFYDENSAGGLMNVDTLTVRGDLSLKVILRYLRRHVELPDKTDALFVVNADNHYRGMLFLADIVTNDPDLLVEDIMSTQIMPIPVNMPSQAVALLFEQHGFISVPVIDQDTTLIGRITVDDILDVIREESDRTLLHRAGLDEEDDMFASTLSTAWARAVWLGINLLTAFLASYVIGQFEGALSQIVALAVLMPIVASMGGIAGTQTLTVMIRGMALGKVSNANAFWLLKKEVAVGVLNGLVWAVVVGVVAMIWFGSFKLGLVIGAAIVINLFFAAFSGMLLPLILKKLSIDPALAGGVILTTVTDIVGFAAFLGLATMWLLK